MSILGYASDIFSHATLDKGLPPKYVLMVILGCLVSHDNWEYAMIKQTGKVKGSENDIFQKLWGYIHTELGHSRV